jgi:hypothetical protein
VNPNNRFYRHFLSLTTTVVLLLLVQIANRADAGQANTKLRLDLHAPRAEIRQTLLRYTPIGTKTVRGSAICFRTT